MLVVQTDQAQKIMVSFETKFSAKPTHGGTGKLSTGGNPVMDWHAINLRGRGA